MSSPTSTSAPNLIPGTSGLAIAPIAAAAQNPVMQIDQKKVPVFHAKPDKDSLTVIHWGARIDGMKDALGWSDEATYANASAALFGVAQRTAANWVILYKTEHCKTWTYLKKKMLSHFGNISGPEGTATFFRRTHFRRTLFRQTYFRQSSLGHILDK